MCRHIHIFTPTYLNIDMIGVCMQYYYIISANYMLFTHICVTFEFRGLLINYGTCFTARSPAPFYTIYMGTLIQTQYTNINEHRSPRKPPTSYYLYTEADVPIQYIYIHTYIPNIGCFMFRFSLRERSSAIRSEIECII